MFLSQACGSRVRVAGEHTTEQWGTLCLFHTPHTPTRARGRDSSTGVNGEEYDIYLPSPECLRFLRVIGLRFCTGPYGQCKKSILSVGFRLNFCPNRIACSKEVVRKESKNGRHFTFLSSFTVFNDLVYFDTV